MGSVNANARSMKLRTILCQAAALSQENSVALMDKLSLNWAFSWALWLPYEANESIVSEWAKQHCWCFQQLSVKSHHIKLIHLGIRPLLSYWKPVEPHGVGLRAQVPEAGPGWAPGRRSDLVSPFSSVLHSLGKPQRDHCGFSQHREMCSLTTTTLLSWAFPSRFGLSHTFSKVTVPFRTRPLFIHELVWLLPCFYIS